MAKKAAHSIDVTLNSVVLEDGVGSVDISLTQELPVVTCFGDAGPRRVVGNYDWGVDLAGALDVSDSKNDATIFGLLASTGVAVSVELTGTDGSASNPEYEGTSVVLDTYHISGKVGGAIEYSASLKGNSAMTRDAS